jgi:5'(3')-deoxyribonucleotidase
LVIVTQPPRKADFAIKEKRQWIKDRFPDYDLSNMIFAHRKYLIDGAVLFDDKPSHLQEWKENHPRGLTVTVEYPYNTDASSDMRFYSKASAWKQFYSYVKSLDHIKDDR